MDYTFREFKLLKWNVLNFKLRINFALFSHPNQAAYQNWLIGVWVCVCLSESE